VLAVAEDTREVVAGSCKQGRGGVGADAKAGDCAGGGRLAAGQGDRAGVGGGPMERLSIGGVEDGDDGDGSGDGEALGATDGVGLAVCGR